MTEYKRLGDYIREVIDRLKRIQKTNVTTYVREKCLQHNNAHNSIRDIEEDTTIAASYKNQAIMASVNSGNIPLDELELYLRKVPVEE